jgi:hypothetical protein
MINHNIFLRTADCVIEWKLSLPYKLSKGDFIHYQILTDNIAKLVRHKKLPESFFEMKFDEYYIVEYVQLSHLCELEIFLTIE